MPTLYKNVPLPIPALKEGDKSDLKSYFSFYEIHRDDISDWAEAELRTHPAWSGIIEAMSEEERLNQRNLSYQAQVQAVYHDNWTPYLEQLAYYGIFYARIGLDFHSWFELVDMVRRYLKPFLYDLESAREIVPIMNGMDIYLDIVMSSIGEAYLLEKKSIIEKQKEEQARLNKELEDFVYITSHDLQEPLNTVSSFLDLLEEDYGHEFSSGALELFSIIKSSSARMKALIKGLLDYSKLGDEKQSQTLPLGLLLEEALQDLSAHISQSGATVRILGTLPALPVFPVTIKLLFQNLVSNAIKFHQKGIAPLVHISAEKEGAQWRFTVEDNGIGIEEKDQEKAFLMFKRLNDAREYEGTGIGLAHCKKIVEAHGGRIWVESIPGHGSKFHFTLPEN